MLETAAVSQSPTVTSVSSDSLPAAPVNPTQVHNYLDYNHTCTTNDRLDRSILNTFPLCSASAYRLVLHPGCHSGKGPQHRQRNPPVTDSEPGSPGLGALGKRYVPTMQQLHPAFWLAGRHTIGKIFGSIVGAYLLFPSSCFSPSVLPIHLVLPAHVCLRHAHPLAAMWGPIWDDPPARSYPCPGHQMRAAARSACRELLASFLSPRWLRPEQRLPSFLTCTLHCALGKAEYKDQL